MHRDPENIYNQCFCKHWNENRVAHFYNSRAYSSDCEKFAIEHTVLFGYEVNTDFEREDDQKLTEKPEPEYPFSPKIIHIDDLLEK